jgi:phosphatidate cytidylyltransferase
VVYVGLAAITLALLRDGDPGAKIILVVIGSVVATDVGAYFAGRTFGGPKIAPSISPSKTWAGLVGGAMAAGITLVGSVSLAGNPQAVSLLPLCLVLGSMVAVIAQAGDFFESWMKRRAGVKDSGNLIPGHGGLFDRVDGLLAVTFVLGIFILLAAGGTPASGGSLLPSPQ